MYFVVKLILTYMCNCRELAWHDLAFYNADLYEGLRRMMLDAEEGKKDQEEFVATYCCYFEVCTRTYTYIIVKSMPYVCFSIIISAPSIA